MEGRGEGDKCEDFRASVTKVGLYSALKMERERGFDSFRLEVSVGSAREGRESLACGRDRGMNATAQLLS